MTESVESIHQAFEALVKEELPYISGTLSLSRTETKLFYRSAGSNGLVDFRTNTDASLKALAEACAPASFGIGGQDVLDESYRKAGKMDAEDFSSQFAPLNHGIVQLIHNNLFKGVPSKREVRVELYKLNVYGPGSFFKAHVDTPRGVDIFGSLVVVLPTEHEGGALVLRHGGKEWIFDSAKAVKPSDPTSLKAGFAIFYSDVEHEVTPVVSGYRVTLTYNLYFAGSTLDRPLEVENSTATEIQRHLKALLADEKFLPEGGLLGFKLVHKYPVNNDTKLADTDLKSSLKGPDGCILLALDALGIKSSLQIFYQIGCDYETGDDTHYMFDQPLGDGYDESNGYYSTTEFAEESNGTLVQHFTLGDCYDASSVDVSASPSEGTGEETAICEDTKVRPKAIYWVNADSSSATRVPTSFIAYGNESSLEHFYGEISIVVHIGPKGARQVVD